MTTPLVLLVIDPTMARHAAIEQSPLEGRARVHRLHRTGDLKDGYFESQFDAVLPEADAVLASPWSWCIPELSDKRWQIADNLRVIAGTFNHRFAGWLDVEEAQRRDVTVVDTSRSMSPAVAEFGLAMTLNALRDIPTAVQLVRAGGWKSAAPWDQPGFVHGELTGRRVGIAGFGAIGRRYAELLSPFLCGVMSFDPFVGDELLKTAGVHRRASLVDLAGESEVFVVAIPSTPGTVGVVDADVIAALPRGAIVIVLTRMAVVDQSALWRRAENGELRAAVDVFDPEPPPPDATFRTSPWVIPTPHIAGSMSACHRRCFTSACHDVLAVLAGEAPRYAVAVRDDRLYRGTVSVQR